MPYKVELSVPKPSYDNNNINNRATELDQTKCENINFKSHYVIAVKPFILFTYQKDMNI